MTARASEQCLSWSVRFAEGVPEFVEFFSSKEIPPFQQEFSSSWGYKNWSLGHKRGPLSLVCQEVSPLCLQYPSLSLLFVLNKFTLFWDTVCLETLFQPTHGPQNFGGLYGDLWGLPPTLSFPFPEPAANRQVAVKQLRKSGQGHCLACSQGHKTGGGPAAANSAGEGSPLLSLP